MEADSHSKGLPYEETSEYSTKGGGENSPPHIKVSHNTNWKEAVLDFPLPHC